ncbi:hypothetical protein DC3_48690 [Deinococcus cellulosilyticus NBRC 106333 = KACC 11606]|uniref:Uncharacterized protein n=2 Tax=Deinococcus cellulosilyticus TaxID=401558 RepID=A0A511N8T0_DEIC1|nr:hypothetical protein DC3_48690 [Deinococcus cellulosilyticus NBRC 106333 = KACC 11606]
MKQQSREYRVKNFSMWGALGVILGSFVIGILSVFVERSNDPTLRNLLLVLIVVYAGAVIYYMEKYQSMLDEMVRLRNAEAIRITFTVLIGGGLAYMLMSGIEPSLPQPDLATLIMGSTTIYLIAYFVLWLRTR